MKKYQCPCCGYFTYNVPANEDCGYICPVCFWENDEARFSNIFIEKRASTCPQSLEKSRLFLMPFL